MNEKIYVVMAVYAPKVDFLKAQIQSVAAQTFRNFHVIFVISDLASSEIVRQFATDAGLDFSINEPLNELDAVRAFERGLRAAFEQSLNDKNDVFFALSDQDDVWHSDKLETLLKTFSDPETVLAHSDARLIDGENREIYPSMFRFEKRRKHPGMRGLLYVNNVTGMTAMMRRDVLEVALPFPKQNGVYFYHDLWLALIASALGKIAFVDRPLVDYRQHGTNAVGAVDRVQTKFKSFLPNKAMFQRGVGAYAIARYLAAVLALRVHERGNSDVLRIDPRVLRPIDTLVKPRSFGGRFFVDSVVNLFRGKLNVARIALGYGFIAMARQGWTFLRLLKEDIDYTYHKFDERLFRIAPGFAPEVLKSEEAPLESNKFEEIVDSRRRPKFRPQFTASEAAINLLVPSLNPADAFAGIVTALDIALGLAKRGHHVRFIATDSTVISKISSLAFLRRRIGAKDANEVLWDRVHLHCSKTEDTIPMHKNDIFLATAWWSAHVANDLVKSYPFLQQKFVYLIQDFEPNFYAWGGEFAGAMASYEMDFIPLFNTTLLRDFFIEQGFDFAKDAEFAFRPSIEVSRYSQGVRTPRSGRKAKVALYGRPEVARNMFSTAIEALADFLEKERLSVGDIEIVSVGLKHDAIKLPTGHVIESLGKLPWEDYPEFLLGVDLGLSLMYSPHPSHPPIEMAASGAKVVTNLFGPKDLSQLSPAIQSAAPNASALCDAMIKAWHSEDVSQDDREIDLAPLGKTLDGLIDDLSGALTNQFAQKKL